jgi:hypothetical protein
LVFLIFFFSKQTEPLKTDLASCLYLWFSISWFYPQPLECPVTFRTFLPKFCNFLIQYKLNVS